MKRKERGVEDAKGAEKKLFASFALLPWRPLRFMLFFFPQAQLKFALIKSRLLLRHVERRVVYDE